MASDDTILSLEQPVSTEQSISSQPEISSEPVISSEQTLSPEQLDEEKLITKLSLNESTKKNFLNLSKVKLKMLPPSFITYVWLEKLILQDCNIKFLKNLPPNLKVLNVTDTNLKRIQHELPNSLETIIIRGSNLQTLENIPYFVSKLDVSDNFLPILDLKEYTCLTSLIATDCCIDKLGGLPQQITHLNLARNKLKTEDDIYEVPLETIDLDMSGNELTNDGIDFIITYISLKTLNITSNLTVTVLDFTDDYAATKTLTNLNISMCNVTELTWMPDNLVIFDGSYNLLTYIGWLPESLKIINLNGNKLDDLPNIPLNIEILQVSYNELTKFEITEKDYPANLKELDISCNHISDADIEILVKTVKNIKRRKHWLKKFTYNSNVEKQKSFTRSSRSSRSSKTYENLSALFNTKQNDDFLAKWLDDNNNGKQYNFHVIKQGAGITI